jgi:hypothetical protein
MTTGIPDLVTQRLDRLERGLRWWKAWGSISAVALAVLAVLGAGPALSPPDTVRARSFTLVDTAGNPRALWVVDDDGAASLMFFDKGPGPNRLLLRLAQDGGVGLVLASKEGKPRVVLGLASEQEGGVLTFTDRTAEHYTIRLFDQGLVVGDDTRDMIVLSTQGTPALNLLAKGGKAAGASFGLDSENKGAYLLLRDAAGRKRAGLSIGPDGAPILNLRDQNELVRAGLTVTADGRAFRLP